jgi:hypothetical protein
VESPHSQRVIQWHLPAAALQDMQGIKFANIQSAVAGEQACGKVIGLQTASLMVV